MLKDSWCESFVEVNKKSGGQCAVPDYVDAWDPGDEDWETGGLTYACELLKKIDLDSILGYI